MKKLSKKTKHYLPKMVKMFSVILADPIFKILDTLFINYGYCRATFTNELCGINNLENVTQWRVIRDKKRKLGFNKILTEKYNFLGKHWVYALRDACSNIHSMWSNLANQIRKSIQNNDNFTKNERHYLYFVLKFSHLWLGILQYNQQAYFDLPKKFQKPYLKVVKQLTDEQLQHADSYLRRLTRRYKMYPHKVSNHNKVMTYDENMYRFPDDNHMRLSTAKSGKPLQIKLTSNWRYNKKGDIQVILNRDKKCLEIHKLIKSHLSNLPKTQEIGIDKGLYTLLSCSSKQEYGVNFSKVSNDEAERLAKKNGERTKHRVNNKMPSAKHYHKKRNGKRAYMNSLINHAVYQMLFNEKPSLIIKEDLAFTKEKLPKIKNKWIAKQRRNLASWAKGKLNDRIEYLCQKYRIPFMDINPAYTSQYCPFCGCKFIKRIGKHNEIAICKNCGAMNANIAASINVKHRKDDPEITLFTPYKKVKEILDGRI